MTDLKQLIKAPKIIGDKVMPRFTDTSTITSGDKTEVVRVETINGTPYLVRSIFSNKAKTPTEKIAQWIDLDLKNNP